MINTTYTGLINNNGPNSLLRFLKNILPRSNRVDIGVAFITSAGLDQIIEDLKKVITKSHSKIRILTGLYQAVTEVTALEKLLTLCKRFPDNFEVKISLEQYFHRKYYALSTNIKTSLIIGSSNLTKEGLVSEGELNAVFTSNNRDLRTNEFVRSFQTEWTHNSVILTDRVIA
ncbi:MAG: hypothetical protein HY606_15140, partial [Planctomycetes bacterium]|nr:hypothetical protein [Planctomycetota bacterium]